MNEFYKNFFELALNINWEDNNWTVDWDKETIEINF